VVKNILDKLKIAIDQSSKIDEPDKNILGIDVGGCIGEFVLEIESICSNVLCFEPNPTNLDILKPKIEEYTNIKLYECCLSDINGHSSLYNLKGEDIPNSRNGTCGLRCGGEKICDVSVYRLDTILDEYDDVLIKFIKIDTEGNDSNIIKGMGKYLYQTQYLMFEMSCLSDFRGNGLPAPKKDIVDYLDSYGFDVYMIRSEEGLTKINGNEWDSKMETSNEYQGDCFCIKKSDSLIDKLIGNIYDTDGDIFKKDIFLV